MKTITLLDPVVEFNPANNIIFEVGYMHGDGDAYTQEEHMFSIEDFSIDPEINALVVAFKAYLVKFLGKRPPEGYKKNLFAEWDLERSDSTTRGYTDDLAKIEWVRMYAYDEDGVKRNMKFS